MEKTLHGCPGCSGDRILVNKPIYDFRDPHPGDIVVFNAPPGWDDEPPPAAAEQPGAARDPRLRPADRLRAAGRAGPGQAGHRRRRADRQGRRRTATCTISDHGPSGPWRKLDEPTSTRPARDPRRATFGPVTVPKGRLWVMGDHRNDSADSRYHCGDGGQDGPDNASCDPIASTVPIDDVIGKAVADRLAAVALEHARHPDDLRERGRRARRHRARPGCGRRAGVLGRAPAAPASDDRRRVGGRVLLVDGSQRVLLIHERLEHGGTHWLTPGGGVEDGEHPREAAAARRSRRPASRSTWPPTPRRCSSPAATGRGPAPTTTRSTTSSSPGSRTARRSRPRALTDVEQTTLIGSRWWTVAELRDTARAARAAGRRRRSRRVAAGSCAGNLVQRHAWLHRDNAAAADRAARHRPRRVRGGAARGPASAWSPVPTRPAAARAPARWWWPPACCRAGGAARSTG